MNLLDMPKIVERSKKRLGRGHGSGKVKTSGRGTKGQKARGTMPQGFEGGQLALIKRLPLLRGKGRNHSQKEWVKLVQLNKLNKMAANSTVTLEVLRKAGIIEPEVRRVKVVGGNHLTVALTVDLPCSAGAKRAIEKAGGKTTNS